MDFVLERGVDAILLVQDCLRTAESPRATDALAAIKRLYTTRGGYTHQEVDEAGYSLFQAFTQEAQQQAQGYVVDGQLHANATPATTSGSYPQAKI